MSNRALRRLHQSREAESSSDTRQINGQLPPDVKQQTVDGITGITQSQQNESGEENSDDAKGQVQQTNRFDLLVEGDDENAHLESNSDEENSQVQPHADNVPAKTKRKNKRKKKKKQTPSETQSPENEEDIDELLEEFGGDYRVRQQQLLLRSHDAISPGLTRDILSVEHKNLNAQNELMRIFGSRVVRADNENRRVRKNRTLRLAQPKDTWPPLTKSGLTMTLTETKGNLHYFTFEHNQHYQRAQQLFMDAVESMNPHNVMEVLRAHPYHIDTLLQISDITRMSEDMPMAADLIERALYAQEAAFHPMFSLTNGNSRLDYRYAENRSFMISLFRHITFVGLKGCYRTSLEFCKLLLSLSPDDDPLGVLLTLDFYALLSNEYSFLTTLFQEWEIGRNLSQLPNFAFSVPLARYKQCLLKGESHVKADLQLQNSLLMFPHVLLPLLEKCSIKPDETVSSHVFFTKCLLDASEPVAIKQLCNLYVGRCYSCWKGSEVMSWLEVNVKVVLDLVAREDSRVTTYQTRRKSRYRGAPLNIYRHILLSEVKGSAMDLPPDIAALSVRNYDPLPPSDSIPTYSRAPRPRTRLQEDDRIFTTFLRSLLPNFNADEAVPEGGAVGGEAPSLQQGIAALMAAMRDLLHNIQPVPPPVENQPDDEHDDEWD